VGKDRRKSGGTSFRPEASNEPGIKTGGRSGNFNSCSAKRTHESNVFLDLKNPNWVSVLRGRTLKLEVSVRMPWLSIMELNRNDREEGEVLTMNTRRSF